MLQFAQYFLSNTREECCEKFYHWDYYGCTGTLPPVSGDYYPDYSTVTSYTCLNDMKMPNYMLDKQNQNWYLSKTLKKCCETHFNYDFNKCMGTQSTGTGKWYAKYNAGGCAQDCDGASPCGGVAQWVDTMSMYSSKRECCTAKFWWVTDCLTK